MKILILGIDALGAESLEVFGLTRLRDRLTRMELGNPSIDNVVSRGWPEIYTGRTAYETGAFYMVPTRGKRRVNQSFATGLSRVLGHLDEQHLLWRALNSRGLSCGVITVPTTSKAQQLEGYFVAATGAGKNSTSMSSDGYYPCNLTKGLGLSGLDMGLRVGFGAYLPDSPEDLEERVNKHLAESFFVAELLIEEQQTDCCFLAMRFLAGIGYKFFRLCRDAPRNAYEERLKSTVLALAKNFDILLDRLISQLDPDQLFIVSDHGLTALDHHINLNELLVRAGELRPTQARNLTKRFVNLRHNIEALPKRPLLYPGYRLEKSSWFSVGYSNLIYLNDERFFGKSVSEEAAYEMSMQMADRLSEIAASEGYPGINGFEAIDRGKYTNAHLDPSQRVAMPNIRCNLEEGAWNSHRTERQVSQANDPDFSSSFFKRGFFAEHSGTKSCDTIAAYSGPHRDLVSLENLPSLYESILSAASAPK